ncbi:unnamed protein product [Allacma fusca]|uniref:Uncharacterized protein n=1 Tax=Allacma fusca TaxID=39272 RepID=A0A8J2L1I8_9HEXA|nr:unnamed protein product [Allacma fusca]
MFWINFKHFGTPRSFDVVPITAITHITWIVANLAVIEFVWRRTNSTLDMLNLLNDIYKKCSEVDLSRKAVKWITKIPWLLCLLSILWYMLDVAIISRANNAKTPCDIRKSIIDGAYSEYLNLRNFNFSNAEEYNSIKNNLIGAIYIVQIFYLDGLTRCCYMACVCGGFAFWLTMNAFLNHIQLQDVHKRLPEVLGILDQFQQALNHASDSLGLLYLMICVAFLPYYCLTLPVLFGGHVLRILDIAFQLTLFGLAVFPAAHVQSTLKSIVPLIQMSYTGEDAAFFSSEINMRANIAIQNLHANTFGLSGKFFVITYGFIGNICGLIVTFAVILSNVTFKVYDFKP